MRDSRAAAQIGPEGGGAPGRLHSWKELAAYLGRDERTVRRLQHTRAGSVYADVAELDAWRVGRTTDLLKQRARPTDVRRTARLRIILLSVMDLLVPAVWLATGIRPAPVRGVKPSQLASDPGTRNGEGTGDFDIYVRWLAGGPPVTDVCVMPALGGPTRAHGEPLAAGWRINRILAGIRRRHAQGAKRGERALRTRGGRGRWDAGGNRAVC